MPGARPHRRLLASGRPLGLDAIDHPAPRQGNARAVARDDRRRCLQRALRRHQQLVELWIRAPLVFRRATRFRRERPGNARAGRRWRIRQPGPSGQVRLQERLIVNQHPRISRATDRVLAALVVALVLGSALCFGGAVWWFRPAFALLASLLALTMLVRLLLERRMP